MHDLVIADLTDRKQLGLDRYGALLQIFNGRNSALDAYQEGLDLVAYLRQNLDEWSLVQGILAAALAWRRDIADRGDAGKLRDATPADQVLAAAVDLLLAIQPQVADLRLDVDGILADVATSGGHAGTAQ